MTQTEEKEVFSKDGIKIFQLPNGRYIGKIEAGKMNFETQEADSLQEAKEFAYFVLNEARTEYQP